MKRKTEKIFWGAFWILAAVFLIVGKLGFLQGIGVWSILFAVFWAAVLIRGVIKLHFGEILFSVAFLCIIFDEQLGIEALTPWTVLAAALLGTIGLDLLFHKKRHYHCLAHHRNAFTERNDAAWGSVEDTPDGDQVYCKANFGSAIKYVDSADFRYAVLECSFGAVNVYFDGASIPSGNATVELNVSFGGVELYVPREWHVVNNARASFGAVDERGRNTSQGTPVLTLTGDVSFAGVTIIYV